MKTLVSIVFCILFLASAKGQSTYAEAIKQGDDAFKNQQYKTAINKYFAAEAFDPSKKDIVKEKINRTFDAIDALRAKAELDKKAAVTAQQQMKLAVEKTNAKQRELINHDSAYVLHIAADSALDYDPTLSLRLEQEAFRKYPNPYFEKTLLDNYNDNSFYRVVQSGEKPVDMSGISADGQSIFYRSKDGTGINIRDLSGKQLNAFVFPQGRIKLTSFSADGNQVLVACTNDLVFLKDLKGDTGLSIFPTGPDKINCAAFSPGGKTILTGSKNNGTVLWDIESKTRLLTLKANSSPVLSVAYSPDEKNIFSISADTVLRRWNANTGELMQQYKAVGSRAGIAVSPNGKLILTALNNNLCLWNMEGEKLREFTGHTGAVSSLAFSPGGNKFISGAADNIARVCYLDGTLIQELKGHRGNVTTVCFAPDDKSMITGADDGTIRQWRFKANLKKEIAGKTPFTYTAVYSPDGQMVLTGHTDEKARLWELNGKLVTEYEENALGVNVVAFSPDGKKFLAGTSFFGFYFLWNIDGSLIRKFEGPAPQKPYAVVFSTDGQTVMIGGERGVYFMDLDGKLLRQIKPPADSVFSAVAFSQDRQTILVSLSNHAILLDQKGDTIRILNGKYWQSSRTLYATCFSPDGNQILTTGDNSTAWLCDLNGNLVQSFGGHQNGISAVAFSPDGKTILIGSRYGKTVCLWDLNGKLIQDCRGQKNISSVAFSPDGTTMLSGSLDPHFGKPGERSLHLWDVLTPLEESLENGYIEPLSDEQKKHYGLPDLKRRPNNIK